MIANDEQLKQAQEAVRNLQTVLQAARRAHSSREYRRMAEPLLLELQERQQEIVLYLSSSQAEAAVSVSEITLLLKP